MSAPTAAKVVPCQNCGRKNRVPAEVSERFGVQAVPTLLVLRKGEVISRQVGAAPAPVLRTLVEQALSGIGDGL